MNLILRMSLYLLIGYGVLVLIVFLFQRHMLFFPTRQQPTTSDVRSIGIRFWPDEGGNYSGFIAAEPPLDAKGVVIVFHGNAGCALDRNYYLSALLPLGYHVVLAEYPGYGGRPGDLNESSFVNDAKATIALAFRDFGGPIYLWGESLGCGVAAAVAARLSQSAKLPIKGLIMTTPWDSLPDLAQTLYWYLPVKWLTRDRFDSIRNLKSFDQKVAIAIAEKDEIIPRRHSMRLYESVSAPKRLWIFKHAGHNSWPSGPDEPWWREVMEFVSDQ